MPLAQDRSYLRWVGGKKRLVNKLGRFLPHDLRGRIYHEPFLGAASLFLSTRPHRAILSDLNEDLISSYRAVKRNPDLVGRYLRLHARNNCESYYYWIRDEYNSSRTFSVSQAARFIYLNRTCFNGIFRVNRKGQFNVPYGRLERPLFPAAQHLRTASQALQTATLKVADFTSVLHSAKCGDFVYFDPPYPALNGTSFFRHYTSDRFNDDDQEQLAEVVRELSARGCLVMVSNADTPLIRDLYEEFSRAWISVARPVTCKKKKHQVGELVITNYEPNGRLP